MKKILLFLIFSLMSAGLLFGNVALPRAWFNELAWDEQGNWSIEIGWFTDDMTYWIDSIQLETVSGISRIVTLDPLVGGFVFDSLAVITNSNLSNPISIDPEYDYVRIRSWVGGGFIDDEVKIGTYQGSYLDCFTTEESLCGGTFQLRYIDSSPSMGLPNSDTTGTTGMFTGTIYDPQGSPLIADYFFFYLEDNYVDRLDINPDGSFQKPIQRRHNSFNEVKVKYEGVSGNTVYRIEPHDFCMEYGYNHHQDIITLFAVGVDEIEPSHENLVIVQPNPFRDAVSFTIDRQKLPGNEELLLRVLTLDGKLLDEKLIGTGTENFKWSPHGSVPSGVLVYQVLSGNKLLSSGKMIKQ